MNTATNKTLVTICVSLAIVLASTTASHGQKKWPFIQPEECSVGVRDPSQLCKATIRRTPPPTTVYDEEFESQPWLISLDEAIRIALGNSEVVRVLAGIQASSSGSTIYDPSISATGIEEAKSRFDPTTTILALT